MGGGASGGIWGHGGVSPHACTHMRMHAHAHTHTCIKFQMAASMEASMFSMFNMHVTCVRACVRMRVRACVHGTPPPTHSCRPPPRSIHPAPPAGGDPWNQLKFDNT